MTITLSSRAPTTRIELLDAAPADLVEEFLSIYREAFLPLETLAPARQALTDAEFREEMVHPGVQKFVARNSEGEATALAFMTNDLTLVPWISVPYFAARYPDEFARQAIFYVGALLVRRQFQGGPWAAMLTDELVRYVAALGGVGAFDCCGYVTSTVKLPELIACVADGVSVYHRELMDSQNYFAFDFQGLK
jgi:hypothetical protein